MNPGFDPAELRQKLAAAKLEFAEDETGGPTIFWTNPWNGKREKVASLWWPTHPPEVTAEVEALWDHLGQLFAESAALCSRPAREDHAAMRDKAIDEVIRTFLLHHAVTNEQADFANTILRSIRALKGGAKP